MKHDNKYKYYPAFVEDVPDPNAFLISCGKTRCEPLTHSKSHGMLETRDLTRRFDGFAAVNSVSLLVSGVGSAR